MSQRTSLWPRMFHTGTLSSWVQLRSNIHIGIWMPKHGLENVWHHSMYYLAHNLAKPHQWTNSRCKLNWRQTIESCLSVLWWSTQRCNASFDWLLLLIDRPWWPKWKIWKWSYFQFPPGRELWCKVNCLRKALIIDTFLIFCFLVVLSQSLNWICLNWNWRLFFCWARWC